MNHCPEFAMNTLDCRAVVCTKLVKYIFEFDLPIIRNISGILIVGGGGKSGSYLRSAEVFNPDTGLTCSVGDMPEPRYDASMCHGLVCGGLNTGSDYDSR